MKETIKSLAKSWNDRGDAASKIFPFFPFGRAGLSARWREKVLSRKPLDVVNLLKAFAQFHRDPPHMANVIWVGRSVGVVAYRGAVFIVPTQLLPTKLLSKVSTGLPGLFRMMVSQAYWARKKGKTRYKRPTSLKGMSILLVLISRRGMRHRDGRWLTGRFMYLEDAARAVIHAKAIDD
jgi:hypothetical protein